MRCGLVYNLSFLKHTLLLNILEEPFMFLAFSGSFVSLRFMSFVHFAVECVFFPLVFFENIGEGVNASSNSKTIFFP